MKISVYGTLKKGQHNHRYLKNSTLLGTSKTPPEFTMYSNGGFPYVCPGGDTAITIETYELSELDQANVFGLEGYTGVRNHPNNWYNTTQVETPWGDSEMFTLDKHPNLPKVTSGEW